MSQSIDWPPPLLGRPRRRRRFFLVLVVLAVIFFGGRAVLSYYVDVLWFRSLGYEDVFWKTLNLQWEIFAAFAAATFLILYGSFLALKRAHLPDLPDGQTILIGGQPVKLPVEPVLRLIALGVSLVIAAASGAALIGEWSTLALFWYAPRTTGSAADPIFGKPLNFFLFALPAWELIAGWLLTLAAILCALAGFFILIAGGARVLAGRLSRHVTLPWRGFSITFAFLLLVLAMRAYIGRFELLLEDHTIFGGVTYTDAHITLTGMLVGLCSTRSWSRDRTRQRRACAAGPLAGGRDSSGRSLLCRGAGDRMVRQQLYRETERTGPREALYRLQYGVDAASLRTGSRLATRVPG